MTSHRTPPSIIAIDGPAASGKSTLGLSIAKALGYLFFDTGIMYRAVTWLAARLRKPSTWGLAEQFEDLVEFPPDGVDGVIEQRVSLGGGDILEHGHLL